MQIVGKSEVTVVRVGSRLAFVPLCGVNGSLCLRSFRAVTIEHVTGLCGPWLAVLRICSYNMRTDSQHSLSLITASNVRMALRMIGAAITLQRNNDE